jgi:hypothetical protein
MGWWVFKGQKLLDFANLYSETAKSWTNVECRRMTSAIYRVRGKYLTECLVNRDGDMKAGELAQILFKIRPSFVSIWQDCVTDTSKKYFCDDVCNMITEFLPKE